MLLRASKTEQEAEGGGGGVGRVGRRAVCDNDGLIREKCCLTRSVFVQQVH